MHPVGATPQAAQAAAGRPAIPGWVNWPLAGILAVFAALLAVLVPAPHLPGALLAYVNLLVIGGTWVYFASRGTLEGLIPPMFLTWLGAGWPLAALYFAIAVPDLEYYTVAGARQFLFGDVRLQAVTLLFTLSYVAVMFLFQGRSVPWRTPVGTRRMDRRAATVVLWMAMPAIAFNAVSVVARFPGLLRYLAAGGYHTLHGLTLMVGVLFTSLALRTRLTAVVFLVGAGAFYVIGNARGTAGFPIALLLFGLIFLSDLNKRWKLWIVTAGLACFPLALVVSDTTRTVTHTGGFTNLNTRLQAFNEWQDALSQRPVLTRTFGRLFFVGGHSIITLSPEHYPYIDFSPSRYASELIMRMLPARFFGHLYYSDPPYTILRLYGFLITDETSVPISTVGALYMLGGVVPVAVGGALIGLFHSTVGYGLRRARRRSPYLALFLFAMIATELLQGQNRDPISHVRSIVWDSAWGVILFQCVVRPLVGDLAPVRGRVRHVRRLALRPT